MKKFNIFNLEVKYEVLPMVVFGAGIDRPLNKEDKSTFVLFVLCVAIGITIVD